MDNTNDSESRVAEDIRQLREEFPDYSFSSTWRSAATGPDCRVLLAWRGGDTAPLAAFSAGELRRRMAEEQSR